jgi:ADP-ribose pyrophosphatase YjhB (NUDIX family)
VTRKDMISALPTLIGAESADDHEESRPALAVLMRDARTEDNRKLTPQAIDWRKTYVDFNQEFLNKEIYLSLVDDDRDPARIIRNRLLKLSYKTETFLRHGNYVNVEVAREFVREGRETEIVPTTVFRGIRGTKRRDETPKKAAQRETEEEVGIRLALERFKAIPDLRFKPLSREYWRDSTVYRHILALDITTYYQAWVRRPAWERFVTPPDNGVKVHFEWRDFRELGAAARFFLDSAVLKVHKTP